MMRLWPRWTRVSRSPVSTQATLAALIVVLVMGEGWCIYGLVRILRTILIVILALLCVSTTVAAQTTLLLGAASKHLNDDTYTDPSGSTRFLNEKNPALAIEQKLGHSVGLKVYLIPSTQPIGAVRVEVRR